MGLLRSVISVTAVLVGVAVFFLFGSIVGIWGETRLGIIGRDGSNSRSVWSKAQEDDDAVAGGAQQSGKENGEMDESTGKVTPPNKHKKKVQPPASRRRQAASR